MIKAKEISRTGKILVVDDQEINRDALGVILEDEYDVDFACDGQEALDIIKEDAKRFDLIMLDIFMPRKNGFEVLGELKADESTEDIPVIVLTADKSAELKALTLGAADFITKPFDLPEVILARVDRIIELSEGRQLISHAEKDQISGLYSKNFFFEYAERLFEYHKDVHFDAISVNIEAFHSINALHGRDFGDEVLRVLGREIALFLKENRGIGGRMEADRFHIYCEHLENPTVLLIRLQGGLEEFNSSVSIHLRMGVSSYREGEDPVLMFDQASVACGLARGDYANPLRYYDDKMRQKELLDQRLLNDLRLALDEHQFVVFYQPKYDIQCNPPRLSSAEALIRWKHPELGMIPPGSFIPLFEGKGLIALVDSFVWLETAKQIRSWREKYGFALPVSVNLSRTDVFDPTLEERLEKLVKDNDLGFSDIKLEVTESACTENGKHVLDVVARLREMGFEIEMDDFGSGYSSLNMLSSMPIDVLKMDMKFIRGIENSETDRRLVSLILDIAQCLQAKVVAEGVESQNQLQFLKDEGCDLVQGYFFSKPLPAEEFEKLIEKELSIKRS